MATQPADIELTENQWTAIDRAVTKALADIANAQLSTWQAYPGPYEARDFIRSAMADMVREILCADHAQANRERQAKHYAESGAQL